MSISRRALLSATAGGGAALAIGFSLRSLLIGAADEPPSADFTPNLWIRIEPAGPIVITIQKCEMGQGVLTALPMLIAEELEVALADVRVEQADADFRFVDQNTSGSSSIIDTWESLRRAGADARSVDLKPHWDFRIIGTPTGRMDARDKCTGRQVYGIDVRVPGMLFAAILRCPVLSARVCSVDPGTQLPSVQLASIDLDATRALPGVRHVIVLDEDIPSRLPPRVAIVASSTWQAQEAAKRVKLRWSEGALASLSSEDIANRLRAAAANEPIVVRDNGQALEHVGAIAAEYSVPFLAHAPMEPINCTAHVRADSVEIWVPTQFPQRAVDHAARVTGLSRDQIRLHVMSMGGAFGRRASPDFVVEAIQVSRAVQAPVQVLWTREQDIRWDFFRPVSLQNLSAKLAANGQPEAWLHRLAGPSIIEQIFPLGACRSKATRSTPR